MAWSGLPSWRCCVRGSPARAGHAAAARATLIRIYSPQISTIPQCFQHKKCRYRSSGKIPRRRICEGCLRESYEYLDIFSVGGIQHGYRDQTCPEHTRYCKCINNHNVHHISLITNRLSLQRGSPASRLAKITDALFTSDPG